VSDPTSGARTAFPTATAAESWRALRRLAKPHRVVLTLAVAALTAGTIAGLIVPPVIGHVVDLVVDGRSPEAITAPALALVGLAVVQTALTFAGETLVALFGERVLADLREQVVERALGAPLRDIERAGSGDLVSRASGDVSVIATAARWALPALAVAALTVGLTVVGLAALDWRFALAALLAAPVQIHTLRWYLRRSSPIYAAERVAEAARTQQLLDSIGGSRTVRAFRLTRLHTDAVRDRSQAAVDLALRANRLATRFYGRLNFAEFLGLGAVLAMGFFLVRSDAASIGAASAAALYFHRLFDPVNTLLGLFDTAQEAGAALARLVGVSSLEQPRVAEPASSSRDAVALDDVSFSYGSRPALAGVTLAIAPGEHVAVVGASGAGKTTLAQLVTGLLEPSAGAVRVRGRVGMVTQEVHVFAGSLGDDLRLAAPAATPEAMWAALDRVGAGQWARQLDHGLDTVVGPDGVTLTAAQSQQVALARLMLCDPPIAVLDEATADAGSAGARELDRAARAALEGRTSVVIAHRLSQAVGADRIVVLADGRIVEVGGHDDLIAAGGVYAALWRAWDAARG
jgi:ATP-binding cassette subfamily C protein